MSQKTRILFPVLLGSNQYTALIAFTPSLALISEQDSPGSSGIEPSGTIGKFTYRLKWGKSIECIRYYGATEGLHFEWLLHCIQNAKE